MNVVFLSTNQTKGGAAIAANRYFDAYRSVGGTSIYASPHVQKPGNGIVQLKRSFLKKKLVKYLFKSEKKKTLRRKIPGEGYWSVSVKPRFFKNKIEKLKPDLLCLNWINDDFLSVKEIGDFNAPVVWVFHDLWAVTGGCHYPGDCIGFQTGCGNCPKLKYSHDQDWSRYLWMQKYKNWADKDITILCPSNWMARKVKESKLFGKKRVEVCPYSIELDIFKPMDSETFRESLGIKSHQKVLLFGAVNSMHDTRKGAHLLVDALKKLENRVPADDLVFLVFGAKESPALESVPFRVINLGFVSEKEDLAKYYAASTAFVLPSLEDNLPNTVLESLGCGTPVVAFDIGGISDMIDHQSNGFLVDETDTNLLADSLEEMVKMPEEKYQRMQKSARKKIEDHFSREVVGNRLNQIFQSILKKDYE
ncbi:glycosyltransferase [Marinilabilia rubra]|uniref:Glycosyl transferase family 1 n=1 Tax=Marinilabilia rubra TaxID=2162893 RepID=A0A2U2B7E5_9BACT|nr:glycosyltransferase [Marinilabilia rubra]PWD98999.1 glycosyl transferase family 1 [Marinilabilia rubra]